MFGATGLHESYEVEHEVLSKGGIGSIHRMVGNPDFVYKHYFSPEKAPDREHLERLVGVGREVLINQARKPGESPESSVNWPVDVIVGASGGVVGTVLPLIPDALFNKDLGGVRGLEFLVMARAKPPSAKGRIVLLLRMAEILAFVHARKLVHGDVNGKNLAWTIEPQPVMYLIDCDGMVPQEPAPDVGVQALGWTDPRVSERRIKAHDHYSDWYALALAMYRGLLLTPGKLDKKPGGSWAAPSKIPAEFPPALAELIRRGLEPLDAERRPAPSEWVAALTSVYLPNRQFDDAAVGRLDAMSAPSPRAQPFVPLPAADWQGAALRVPAPAPPGQPAPVANIHPGPPPQPRAPAPPPPPVPQWQPGPSWNGPTVSRGPSGEIAQKALSPTFGWYLKGIAATLIFGPLALIYVGLAYFQIRDLDDQYPGVARTRLTLKVFAAASLLMTVVLLSH